MFVIRLAIRNVVRQRRRSAIALLAIVCGISSLILAAGFIEWNLRYGRESTIHSQLGHIQIFRSGYLDMGTADPFKYILPENELLREKIQSLPHVIALAPRLHFSGLIGHGESTLSFLGEGVDPDRERLLSRSINIVEGSGLSADHAREVIMGQGLATNLGVKPGDMVVLVATTESGGVNAVETQVVGIFTTITKAYDDSALRVPISLARQLLRVSGAHSYALVLDSTENTDEVVSMLGQRVRGEKLDVVPWYRLADFYNKTAELFSRQVGVLRLIIAAIMVLSISNSMMMSVLERTGEIGTAMALGARRLGMLQLFLTEGALLGVIGGAVGVIAGYLLALLVSAVGIPMPPPPGMAFGYTAGILVRGPLAVKAFALATATALGASLYPSWKASRMNIVDALRRNR